MVTIKDNKVKPSKKIVNDLPIQVLYIPLKTTSGILYKETIKVGGYVKIGTVLGKNAIADTPLLSSTSGTIVGFTEKYLANNELVRCIVIENDFKEKYETKIGKKYDITKYSKDEFIYLLKQSAIFGMSGNGFPTYIKYENSNKLKYLIVNGAECEILASADSSKMYHNPEEILECIDAMIDILGLEKAYIAISKDNTKIIEKFLRHINSYPNIKVYPLENAYPSGYERYLVNAILGLTYDKYPPEVGAIVENVSTIYAIYEALKYHKPLTERVVTITGEGIKEPANYLLKIGTNFNEVLLKTNIYKKLNNPLLIAGGLMMGKCIESDELIVTPDLNCIIVTKDKQEKTTPCIKCGKCSEVCPMNLIPSLIMDNPNKSKELMIDKCINCGLCSYICPSKIEVRELIKKIKEQNNERV